MSRTLTEEERETGPGAAGKIPVFGILERGEKVRVEVVQNVNGEPLLIPWSTLI